MGSHRPRGRSKARTTNYTKGRAVEYAIKQVLTDSGYSVTRAAGSHGHYDLVAGLKNQTWAIQVKNRPPTKDEYHDIREASRQWYVPHCIIWIEGPGWGWRTYTRGHEIGLRPPFTPTSEEADADHA